MATDLIYKSAQSTETQPTETQSAPGHSYLTPIAIGSLLGAMVSALAELRKEKERRNYLRALLTGGALGGGAGLIYRLLASALKAEPKTKVEIKKEPSTKGKDVITITPKTKHFPGITRSIAENIPEFPGVSRVAPSGIAKATTATLTLFSPEIVKAVMAVGRKIGGKGALDRVKVGDLVIEIAKQLEPGMEINTYEDALAAFGRSGKLAFEVKPTWFGLKGDTFRFELDPVAVRDNLIKYLKEKKLITGDTIEPEAQNLLNRLEEAKKYARSWPSERKATTVVLSTPKDPLRETIGNLFKKQKAEHRRLFIKSPWAVIKSKGRTGYEPKFRTTLAELSDIPRFRAEVEGLFAPTSGGELEWGKRPIGKMKFPELAKGYPWFAERRLPVWASRGLGGAMLLALINEALQSKK